MSTDTIADIERMMAAFQHVHINTGALTAAVRSQVSDRGPLTPADPGGKSSLRDGSPARPTTAPDWPVKATPTANGAVSLV